MTIEPKLVRAAHNATDLLMQDIKGVKGVKAVLLSAEDGKLD